MEFTSIFGIQSGFDSASVVQKLIALQARPIDLKLAQLEAKETELEVFQSLRTQLQTFQSALQKMNTASRFSANTASFNVNAGTGNVLSASTTSSAVAGTHNIDVTGLNQVGIVISDSTYANLSDPVSSNANHDFRITLGGVTTPFDDIGNNSVQELIDTINASDVEVTASAVDTGSGYKIVIEGNNPGSANTVAARLRIPGPDEIYDSVQDASDATLTVNGIDYTRTTNSISDIITGVTLDLESIGSGSLVIASDTTEITANIQDFVNGFNTLIGFIDEQTEFNPETFAAATLFGNSTVQGLETTLRRIATGQVTGGSTYEFLSQIGITTQSDGTLSLDEAKLKNALATDLTNVVELFTSSNGVITRLDNEMSVLLDSSQQGPLTSELDSLTGSIDDLNDTLLRMDERLEIFEKKIRQEFINLEIILGRLDSQRNAFQQALQNLNGFFDQ